MTRWAGAGHTGPDSSLHGGLPGHPKPTREAHPKAAGGNVAWLPAKQWAGAGRAGLDSSLLGGP
eukprot:14144860-Alexandrium_andersonii.AAC.1